MNNGHNSPIYFRTYQPSALAQLLPSESTRNVRTLRDREGKDDNTVVVRLAATEKEGEEDRLTGAEFIPTATVRVAEKSLVEANFEIEGVVQHTIQEIHVKPEGSRPRSPQRMT